MPPTMPFGTLEKALDTSNRLTYPSRKGRECSASRICSVPWPVLHPVRQNWDGDRCCSTCNRICLVTHLITTRYSAEGIWMGGSSQHSPSPIWELIFDRSSCVCKVRQGANLAISKEIKQEQCFGWHIAWFAGNHHLSLCYLVRLSLL
jgi:hypothetical protein